MLQDKKCAPCRGGVAPYTVQEIGSKLQEIPGWSLSSDKPLRLSREFRFKDFAAALAFVNRVGALAEAEGHHPNIVLHDWNRVTLELYTHKIRGLHENDFIMAAKINSL